MAIIRVLPRRTRDWAGHYVPHVAVFGVVAGRPVLIFALHLAFLTALVEDDVTHALVFYMRPEV